MAATASDDRNLVSDETLEAVFPRERADAALSKYYFHMVNSTINISWTCVLTNNSMMTLHPLDCSRDSGHLASSQPTIPPQHTGISTWVKYRNTPCGACGVLKYRIGSSPDGQIINIMASIPYDWNTNEVKYSVWISNDHKVTYSAMVRRDPVVANEYDTSFHDVPEEKCKFYMKKNKKAMLKVIYG